MDFARGPPESIKANHWCSPQGVHPQKWQQRQYQDVHRPSCYWQHIVRPQKSNISKVMASLIYEPPCVPSLHQQRSQQPLPEIKANDDHCLKIKLFLKGVLIL